jgi:hypothetical protein
MRAALGAKTDGDRSPVSLDDCHLPSTRFTSFGQFAADAHDASQTTSGSSSTKKGNYQTFLDAETKVDAVSALGEYLRMAWRVPTSEDESAPGRV